MFKIFDEVTADNLELDDLILIDDTASSESVYVLIDDIRDDVLNIILKTHDLTDSNIEYEVTLDPDEKISLYMEVDED